MVGSLSKSKDNNVGPRILEKIAKPLITPYTEEASATSPIDRHTGCQLALLFKGHNSIPWAPNYIIISDCISFSRSPTFRW